MATSADPRPIGLGFRRVTLVRAVTGGDDPHFEVEGVLHRRPVTQKITPSMALRLVAAGTPLVVRENQPC